MLTIDYYFAPISGYAYLGHQAFMNIARDAGATVNFCPVEIAKVFAASETTPPFAQSDVRRSYRIEDQARWAALRGVRMAEVPANWPTDPRLACRAILAAGELGVDQDAATLACLYAVWTEERDIADPGDLGEALAASNLPAHQILERASEEDMRDAADALTQRAIDAQVFGSPTYVVNGQRFWGQDRLEFLAEALRNA